jgi:hypothetical protein
VTHIQSNLESLTIKRRIKGTCCNMSQVGGKYKNLLIFPFGYRTLTEASHNFLVDHFRHPRFLEYLYRRQVRYGLKTQQLQVTQWGHWRTQLVMSFAAMRPKETQTDMMQSLVDAHVTSNRGSMIRGKMSRQRERGTMMSMSSSVLFWTGWKTTCCLPSMRERRSWRT